MTGTGVFGVEGVYASGVEVTASVTDEESGDSFCCCTFVLLLMVLFSVITDSSFSPESSATGTDSVAGGTSVGATDVDAGEGGEVTVAEAEAKEVEVEEADSPRGDEGADEAGDGVLEESGLLIDRVPAGLATFLSKIY